MQGPLSVMDEVEFTHWMRCMALRCALVSRHALDRGLTALQTSKKPLQSSIKVTAWALHHRAAMWMHVHLCSCFLVYR